MKRHFFKNMRLLVLPMLLAIFFSGCGSGGILAGGGMGGSGIISKGVILAFGSIVVNGTEFDTTNALVIVDGSEVGVGDDAVLSNLDIGKFVTAIGTGGEDSGDTVADKVIYDSNLVGPVESVADGDETAKEMVVLGQTVMVNYLTEFKGTGLASVSINDIIEISGYFDDRGVIWATFIEKKGEFAPDVLVELTGYVENLDTVRKTFQIKNQTIDYSMADMENLPDGLPAEGLYVEVEGSLGAVGEKLLATGIELADELEISDADQMEMMGFVTDVMSESEFKVGNHIVRIDEMVEYVDGGPENIAPGVKLEAEGMLIDDILHAWEIEFWEPDQIEVEGVVTDIISDSGFILGNQVVQTDNETVFVDGTPDDLNIGTLVEIKGRIVDDILVADKVSFELE